VGRTVSSRTMLHVKNVAVVLAAYNAERTFLATVAEIPECFDTRTVVGDASSAETAGLGRNWD
jgi:hypothetical protein